MNEGGPKGRTAGSKRDIAETTGVSPAAQVKLERHRPDFVSETFLVVRVLV
jgi:hypothetical protein